MSGNPGGSWAMRWLGRAALAAVGLALVLAALIAFVVPGVLRSQASKGMEVATGRQLAIGAISINPFTWMVAFRNVSLSEPGRKETFASFRSGRVAVSPSSLWRGAPIISRVRLESPHFNVVRSGPNTYNLSDLIKYLIPMPPLSLNDVRVTGGVIDFLDQALPRKERHTARDAELVIPFLTTIPHLASEYGSLHFSAVIDSAPLVIEAQVRGLPKAVEATAQVNLKNLSLPAYRSYLPAGIAVQVESGKASVQGTASYRVTADAGPEGSWDGIVAITEIKASDPQGPLRVDGGEVALRSRFSLGEKTGMILEDGAGEVRNCSVPFGEHDGMTFGLLSIRGVTFAEKENRMNVAGVLLEKGRIRLSRDRKGVFSHMALLEDMERRLPVRWRGGKIEGTGIEAIRVDELVVQDGALRFTDRGIPGEFRASVSDLDVRVTGLSSEPGKAADVHVQAVLQKSARLRIAGRAAPLKKRAFADFNLSLDRLDLATATPYSGTYLGLEVDRGALTVKSRTRIDQGRLAAENRIRVDQLTFGKPVHSDKATLLPVRLLVDILRDKNGDIALDIPLSASTDDENLLGSIVLQVAKDIVFPAGSPLQSIAFAECSTDLSPDAQGRLRKLAAALEERPALKINAVGYVDRAVDGKACRERVAAKKGAAPALDGDARMKQLAEGRAAAVRNFLVEQGRTYPARVFARTRDIYGTPRKKGDRQARVEFAPADD